VLQLDTSRQELHNALKKLCKKKHARRAKKERRTTTRRVVPASIRIEEQAYNPQQPYYLLDEYISRESFSDQETIETEESMADNFNIKGNDKDMGLTHGHTDADGYAQELYKMRDEQLAQDKGKAVYRDLHREQFK
jgi:hypothetical protein